MCEPDTKPDTRNILQLVLAMAGETEVPRDFYLWSAMSLIAACLKNHVWFEHMTYKPIRPNLYVMLVGPSGDGKGHAMGLVTKIAREASIGDVGMNFDLFSGRLTGAGIYDQISSEHQEGEEPESKALWLHSDELAASVRTGEMARDILKILTDLWEAHGNIRLEYTRGGGLRTARDPTLNWLAGTTSNWLNEVVDFADINSGFFARTIVVKAERTGNPIYEPDTSQYHSLFPLVKQKLEIIWQYQGPMVVSPDAKVIERQWYEEASATPPTLTCLYPTWKRRLDIVHKFAMILQCAHAKTEGWQVIEPDASALAIQMYTDLLRQHGEIIEGLVMGKSDRKMERVIAVLKKHGRKPKEILNSHLQRLCSPYGIRKEHLTSILDTLRDESSIRKSQDGNGVYYQWIGE